MVKKYKDMLIDKAYVCEIIVKIVDQPCEMNSMKIIVAVRRSHLSVVK